jgi:hypothetical protein
VQLLTIYHPYKAEDALRGGFLLSAFWLACLCLCLRKSGEELELELIQTQMAQKPMLRAEVGMRVRCANKASAE